MRKILLAITLVLSFMAASLVAIAPASAHTNSDHCSNETYTVSTRTVAIRNYKNKGQLHANGAPCVFYVAIRCSFSFWGSQYDEWYYGNNHYQTLKGWSFEAYKTCPETYQWVSSYWGADWMQAN